MILAGLRGHVGGIDGHGHHDRAAGACSGVRSARWPRCWACSSSFWAGPICPVSTFPPALRFLAYLLPYTWGYDLIRYYSFDGEWPTLLPVWQEWVIVVAYAVLFTLLSRHLLARSETKAKQGGLHVI